MGNSLQKKWSQDPIRMKRITNSDLTCRNCARRYDDAIVFGNTSRCAAYEDVKPAEVLCGGACQRKLKQQ